MENIKLLSNRVLIETSTKTDSGFILSDVGSKDEINKGVVVAVGPGRDTEAGHVAIKVAVGETVLFQYATKIEIDGSSYMLARDEDIVLVMTDQK